MVSYSRKIIFEYCSKIYNIFFLVNDLENVSWKTIAGELKPYIIKYNSLVSSLIENGNFLSLHALLLNKMATSEDKPALLNLCLTWFNDIKVK